MEDLMEYINTVQEAVASIIISDIDLDEWLLNNAKSALIGKPNKYIDSIINRYNEQLLVRFNRLTLAEVEEMLQGKPLKEITKGFKSKKINSKNLPYEEFVMNSFKDTSLRLCNQNLIKSLMKACAFKAAMDLAKEKEGDIKC